MLGENRPLSNQIQLLPVMGAAHFPRPRSNLEAEKENSASLSACTGGFERAERSWNSSLSTLSSPAAEKICDIFCDRDNAEKNWTDGNVDTPVETHPSTFANTNEDTFVRVNLPELGEEVVSAPYEYITSLPSKGVRDQVIDALNDWFEVPAESVKIIKAIGNRLHNASLMLDDFEDQSPLRRGQPSTHNIFGAAQTVNSANFQIIVTLDDIRLLNNPACLTIFIEEMRSLYIGQSLDLYWTHNIICPSIPDYLKMVDKKTGGLFRLLSKLMTACSPIGHDRDIDSLTILLGRLYQIRDDYQNLVSKDYATLKGFCEDLDEGKYSLPLIHALQQEPENMQLRSILVQRRVAGQLNLVHKQFVLQHLARTQSLDFTTLVLKLIYSEAIRIIERVEKRFQKENKSLRLILHLLSV